MTSPAHHDPERLASATLTAARLNGCRCDPDLEVVDDLHLAGLYHVHISHDDWCPILQRRTARWN